MDGSYFVKPFDLLAVEVLDVLVFVGAVGQNLFCEALELFYGCVFSGVLLSERHLWCLDLFGQQLDGLYNIHFVELLQYSWQLAVQCLAAFIQIVQVAPLHPWKHNELQAELLPTLS